MVQPHSCCVHRIFRASTGGGGRRGNTRCMPPCLETSIPAIIQRLLLPRPKVQTWLHRRTPQGCGRNVGVCHNCAALVYSTLNAQHCERLLRPAGWQWCPLGTCFSGVARSSSPGLPCPAAVWTCRLRRTCWAACWGLLPPTGSWGWTTCSRRCSPLRMPSRDATSWLQRCWL